MLARAANGRLDDIWGKWFGDEIEGTVLHAVDGKLDGADRSEKYDRNRRVGFLRCREDFQSGSIRHALIGYNNVVIIAPKAGDCRTHSFGLCY